MFESTSCKELIRFMNRFEEDMAEKLFKMEKNDGINYQFLDEYENLLSVRLEYCRLYIEQMEKLRNNSFWFMKPFINKHIRIIAELHNANLGRLISVMTLKHVINH